MLHLLEQALQCAVGVVVLIDVGLICLGYRQYRCTVL